MSLGASHPFGATQQHMGLRALGFGVSGFWGLGSSPSWDNIEVWVVSRTVSVMILFVLLPQKIHKACIDAL